MTSAAATVDEYMAQLPEERKAPMEKLRKIIKKNLPKGFKEEMGYGMMGYVVPHTIYPSGYHCNPKLPLPFMGMASQKNNISVYHMGLYADGDLMQWFQEAHAKASPKKLDMGKSCIRYKKAEDIPFELIGELCTKLTPQQWIALYEKAFRK